jgi:Ca2+-binding RTX toxin-like protein
MSEDGGNTQLDFGEGNTLTLNETASSDLSPEIFVSAEDGTSLGLLLPFDETVSGSDDADTLDGGAGDDILIGGGDEDTFVYDVDSGGSDTIADYESGEKIALKFKDPAVLANMEMSEDGGNTQLDFGEGNTLTLNGMTSSLNPDWFVSAEDGTSLKGQIAISETKVGTQYADDLETGLGDDTLIGREGDDTLTGGAGEDTFVYNVSSGGHDEISDFTLGEDHITLEGLENYDFSKIGIHAFYSDPDSEEGPSTFISFDEKGWNQPGGNSLLVKGLSPAQLPEQVSDMFQAAEGTSAEIATELGQTLKTAIDENLAKQEEASNFVEGKDVVDDGWFVSAGEGDDTLEGSTAEISQILVGKGGKDTFVYDVDNGGQDLIADYESGEKIALKFKDPAVLANANLGMTEDGGSAQLDFGDGNMLIITGTSSTPINLQPSMFMNAEDGTSLDLLLPFAGISVGSDDADTLDGGAGDDILIGGGGEDTFVYDVDNGGQDFIADYESGEKIALNFKDPAVLANMEMSEDGGNTQLDFGEGNTLTLNETASSDLSPEIFVSAEDGTSLKGVEGFSDALSSNVDEGSYTDGQPEIFEYTHEDGSVETTTYVDGQPQSSETTYSDGSVKTTAYTDGQPESSEIVYSDGIVMTSDDLDADGEGEFQGELTSDGTLTLKEDGSGPLSWESADQSQSASWEADGSGTYQSSQGEGTISNTSYDAETGTVTFTDDMNSTGTITSDGTLNLQFSDEESYGTDDGDVSNEELAGLDSTSEDETGTGSEEESGTGEDSGVGDILAGAFDGPGEPEEGTTQDDVDMVFNALEAEAAAADAESDEGTDTSEGETSSDDEPDEGESDEEWKPPPEDS